MAAPALVVGQSQSGLEPSAILKPLGGSWPTFSGDYTGRRYSLLAQINQLNVKQLTLAWMTRIAPGARGGVPPTIVGGVGTREFAGGTIKGAVLAVNGVLYVTAPDNVWARAVPVTNRIASGSMPRREIILIITYS